MCKTVAKGLNIAFLGWIAKIVLFCIALALDEGSEIREFLPWLGYLIMLFGLWTAKEGEETFGKALAGMVAFFLCEGVRILVSEEGSSNKPTGAAMILAIFGVIASAAMVYFVCDGILRALYYQDAPQLEKRSNTVWYLTLAYTLIYIVTIGFLALGAAGFGAFLYVLALILNLVASVLLGLLLYSSSAYLSKVDDQAETEPEQKEP